MRESDLPDPRMTHIEASAETLGDIARFPEEFEKAIDGLMIPMIEAKTEEDDNEV